MDENLYRLESVALSYGGRTVLDIDRLALQRGRVYAVVGPNGAGKSSLLNLLSFLQKPTSGRLFFLGEEAWRNGFDPVAGRRRTAMVMQSPYLFGETIGRNVAYGLRRRGLAASEADRRVRESLALVRLEGMADRPADGISGGEAKRVALARALALDADVLLLDECTTNLDSATIAVIES
ncbi:MAG: hypothetical protein A2Z34_00350, partial [Planctomycetes bacterium RBG_16_59_8]